MLGFLFGAACLVGLAGVARGGCGRHAFAGEGHGPCGYGPRGWHARHWGGEERGFGHGPHHGHHRHSGHHGHGGREGWRAPRRMMRQVFERLETSPGQEKVILDAMDGVRTAGEKFRGELGNSRQEISRALRGEHFDTAALRELFAKHDALVGELRESLIGGLSQVHEALDDRQRRELSEWVEDAGRFGFGRWA